MPSIFAAADAQSSAAVSFVFGERVLWIPWKAGGQYTRAGGPDPDRQPVEIERAVLSGELGSQSLQGDRKTGEGFRGTVTTRDRTLSVDKADWPAGVRDGDRIQALDQAGAPSYTILTSDDDGMNRIVSQMVKT